MKEMTVHKNGKPIYDIVFRYDFSDLPVLLQQFNASCRRICIVSETNVASYYLEEIISLIKPHCAECTNFVFPEGEQSKNLDTVKQLYEHLILSHFDRNDLLIALGGGVVGDLTGYTAATYLRGIDFIQIPTSLLSQVDSSIGGKTGVDFDSYKNMVGAFHQPKLVYMNLTTLLTLNDRQFRSGLGEIIKHGLIKDNAYYKWIRDNFDAINNRDIQILQELVSKSCDIKRLVVEKDPTEKGDRALLNFGHTLGHAVEKIMNFQLFHGECVAIGCILAAIISKNKHLISEEDVNDIRTSFDAFHFQNMPSDIDIKEVVRITKNDKKMTAGTIKFILLKKIGDAYIDLTVSDNDMELAMSELLEG